MPTWIAPVTKICHYWYKVLSPCAMGVDRDIYTLLLSDNSGSIRQAPTHLNSSVKKIHIYCKRPPLANSTANLVKVGQLQK